ncbi:MAG: malectin domain-containing carbohydrate-binding protein, partial [Planctomycetaceae bacterium]
LDYPSVGGDSPDVPVTVEGEGVEYFRHHPSRMSGEGQNWITCCGLKGAATIRISLENDPNAPKRPYTVRLHFAEIDAQPSGKRVFDVQIQGANVLSGFDIASEVGGPNLGITKEFKQVEAGRELSIALTPVSGQPLLCGVEIVAEGW